MRKGSALFELEVQKLTKLQVLPLFSISLVCWLVKRDHEWLHWPFNTKTIYKITLENELLS